MTKNRDIFCNFSKIFSRICKICRFLKLKKKVNTCKKGLSCLLSLRASMSWSRFLVLPGVSVRIEWHSTTTSTSLAPGLGAAILVACASFSRCCCCWWWCRLSSMTFRQPGTVLRAPKKSIQQFFYSLFENKIFVIWEFKKILSIISRNFNILKTIIFFISKCWQEILKNFFEIWKYFWFDIFLTFM